MLEREQNMLLKLKNDNIQEFIGLCQDQQQFGFIFEHLDTNLFIYLNDPVLQLKTLLDDALKRSWSLQICDGLQYLHSQQVVHKNLKPATILLSEDLKIAKIGDYGMDQIKASIKIPDNTPTDRFHIAPEAKNRNQYTVKSDIYALGLILYEIHTKQMIDNVVEEEDVDELIEDLQSAKIIKQCISLKNRPTLTQIIGCFRQQETKSETVQRQSGSQFRIVRKNAPAIVLTPKSNPPSTNVPNTDSASLYLAAKQGNLELCKQLIAKNADVNQPDALGETPLHAASSTGNADICQLLLDNGASSRVRNSHGKTPFNVAKNGYIRSLMIKSEKGKSNSPASSKKADLVNSSSQESITPAPVKPQSATQYSAKPAPVNPPPANTAKPQSVKQPVKQEVYHTTNNPFHVLEVESTKGDNPEPQSGRKASKKPAQSTKTEQKTVKESQISASQAAIRQELSQAIKSQKVKKCQELIPKLDPIDYKDKQGWTPLFHAAELGNLEICTLLLSHRASVKTKAKDGLTALHIAASMGLYDLCNLFIRYNADLDAQNKQRCTPLYLAAQNRHFNVTELLVDEGANLYLESTNGWHPIYAATHEGDLEIVKLLVENGVPVQSHPKDHSLMFMALTHGRLEISKFFVECGVDVNIKDDRGYRPLQLAANDGNLEAVKFFVDEGAEIDARNYQGATALHNAACGGFADVCAYLLDKGANIAARRKDGITPIQLAVSEKQFEAAKVLLDRGADPNTSLPMGVSLIMMASHTGRLDICKLLVEKGANYRAKTTTGVSVIDGAGSQEVLDYFSDLLDH
ncbi:ankyrin repeat-containing domain protein [Gorgonomyces haynaldii]|nr:ankyrin repeat-containing domain protein [Gorgonomyces haynaldii]